MGERKKPAIGSFLSNTVDDLNIGGTETKSAIFWGASVKASNGEESVTGDNQSIRRAVPKNSRISLYFWDSRNDNSAFLGVKVNDNLIAGAYGNTDKYVYTKNGGSGWSSTSVAKSYGWHKLVFDGAAEAGKITLYLDGESIETVSGDTEYLEIGNLWAVAGFAYFAVDNITVSREFIPAVSNLRVMDHKTSLEIAYDYSHTGNKAEGKTKFQWYRKNDSGTFEKIDNATEQIYTYKFPDDMGKTFRVEVTPVDVNGVIGDTVTSTEFTESYMNSIKPTVSAASIVENVYAGAELRAQYTATGGTDASKDQYQWYVSENGSEWKAIAGATGSVYTAGTEIIGKQLKFTVSVAGAEGSYSDWFECQPVRDTTTLIQMITAVKSKSSMGRNQEMLAFLKLLDPAFSGYSVGHQQKIVLKLFDTAVSTEAEYQALVSKILQEDDDVPDSDLFGIDKNHGIIVDGSTGTGGTEYRKFTDIDSVEWAKEAIYALTNQQILSGKGERLFCPNDNITRAEFVTLLVRAFFGNETNTKQVFTDVSEDAWYAPQIAAAYAKGLVSGKGDGTFGPNEAITREEMAVLCARVEALGVCDAGEEREYSAFADENDISEYAYDSVVAMYQKGFINGVGENRFHAKGYTTRAMAAALIYKMMKKENRRDATGNTVSEDFEVWPGIFKPGNPQDSSIGEATDGEFSYSGTGSLKIIGKNEAYTAAGSNRAFRVMIYDDADKTSITAMMSVGSYRLGLNTSGKSRVENYAYAVGNTWTDAGVTRTTGWHEFIIDMSRVGFVDLYIDGNKVAELEAKDENPEYVLIGNEWHNSTSAAYADEFRMARTLEELREIKGRGYSNGNELIEETEMSVENLPESIREAAGLLYTLKILAVENGADVDRKITKEEFLYLVCGMMNQSAAAKKATKAYFSDVAANSRYAGYVQYAVEQGLIDGNEDRLGAQDAVSGAFGARLMMTLLGYGKAGSNQDESWWLQKATQIGLFKGLQSTFGELSLSDAIMLCYNTLLTDVFQVEGLEKNQPEYSESNGVTLLNYRFDVYSGEDYLNGVYGAELSETKTLSKNEALIGNTVVNSYDSNLARYNGMKIRAYLYAPEANDKTLIYAFNRKKNTELTISAHDLVSVDGKKLNYTDQSKIKNAKLTTDLKVVYNGSYLFGYTTENLIPEIGYVRLVDRDADGSYDIAFVMEYKPIKVQGLDIDKKLVYDEYEDTAYDFGDTEFITTGLYQHFALESLQKDQFILMAVSQDGKRVDILADGTEIEGSVDRLQDEYISIDGTEYYRVVSLDSYYKRKGLQGITVGMTGTFTVDAFGNIIGTSSVASSSRHFGYLIHAWQDDNEGRYHIKLYADTGKIEEYEFAEQITYNGSKTKNPDAVLSLSPQLVRFKISSEGVLNVLETADTENQNSDSLKGSDSFWLFRDADVWYRDNGYQFGLALRIAKDTPVMFVPNAENIKNEKKYSIGSYASFSNGQTFHYKAYNADEYNFPEIIVVEAVSTGKLKNGNESPLFVVKSITEEIDEDNQTVNMLNGYESGVLTSYPIAEDVDLDAVKQGYGYTNDIEAGDTFMTYFNPNGEISDLKYITHMQEASDQYNDLSSWNFVFDNISCCYAKVDSMGKALRITDGIHQSVIGTPQRVYVYSQALKTLTTGTTADLISGREIAIRTCHGNTREVIVYVD